MDLPMPTDTQLARLVQSLGAKDAESIGRLAQSSKTDARAVAMLCLTDEVTIGTLRAVVEECALGYRLAKVEEEIAHQEARLHRIELDLGYWTRCLEESARRHQDEQVQAYRPMVAAYQEDAAVTNRALDLLRTKAAELSTVQAH